jgi:hypothetical protein
MDKASFTVDELYAYYSRNTKSNPIVYTSSSFEALVNSGARKLIAKNSSGIRCMLIFFHIENEIHVLSSSGDIDRLGKSKPKGNVVQTIWQNTKEYQETLVRLIFLDKEKRLATRKRDLQKIGFNFEIQPDTQFSGLFRSEISIGGILLGHMVLCKCLYKGESAVVLSYCSRESPIEIRLLVEIILCNAKSLSASVLLIADNVLAGCQTFSHDYCCVGRTKESAWFFP